MANAPILKAKGLFLKSNFYNQELIAHPVVIEPSASPLSYGNGTFNFMISNTGSLDADNLLVNVNTQKC